jgi:hypothetical protein
MLKQDTRSVIDFITIQLGLIHVRQGQMGRCPSVKLLGDQQPTGLGEQLDDYLGDRDRDILPRIRDLADPCDKSAAQKP